MKEIGKNAQRGTRRVWELDNWNQIQRMELKLDWIDFSRKGFRLFNLVWLAIAWSSALKQKWQWKTYRSNPIFLEICFFVGVMTTNDVNRFLGKGEIHMYRHSLHPFPNILVLCLPFQESWVDLDLYVWQFLHFSVRFLFRNLGNSVFRRPVVVFTEVLHDNTVSTTAACLVNLPPYPTKVL